MQDLFEDILPRETLDVADGNPILDELRDFVTAIRSGARPQVTGHDGAAAVDVATQVVRQIRQRRTLVADYIAPTRKAG